MSIRCIIFRVIQCSSASALCFCAFAEHSPRVVSQQHDHNSTHTLSLFFSHICFTFRFINCGSANHMFCFIRAKYTNHSSHDILILLLFLPLLSSISVSIYIQTQDTTNSFSLTQIQPQHIRFLFLPFAPDSSFFFSLRNRGIKIFLSITDALDIVAALTRIRLCIGFVGIFFYLKNPNLRLLEKIFGYLSPAFHFTNCSATRSVENTTQQYSSRAPTEKTICKKILFPHLHTCTKVVEK